MGTAGLVAALCLLLQGCPIYPGDREIPTDMVTGVSRAPDGSPMAVIVTCGKEADELSLWDGEKLRALWTNPAGAKGMIILDLTKENGWTARQAFSGLTPGVSYALRARGGSTIEDEHGATTIVFTLADLDRLTPGQIRYEPLPGGTARPVTISPDTPGAPVCPRAGG